MLQGKVTSLDTVASWIAPVPKFRMCLFVSSASWSEYWQCLEMKYGSSAKVSNICFPHHQLPHFLSLTANINVRKFGFLISNENIESIVSLDAKFVKYWKPSMQNIESPLDQRFSTTGLRT